MIKNRNIKEFKQNVTLDILANKLKYFDCNYFTIFQILQSINCEDTDYIPKVAGAGEFYEDPIQPYQLMHNGVKVTKYEYGGAVTGSIIYGLKGHHEPQEEKVFYEILQSMPSKATMIELGSAWAYYSLWFAKHVAEPINFMVEPYRSQLDIGIKNFSLNNFKGNFIHGYLTRQVDHTDPIEVNGSQEISIDSFLIEHNIDHVNIMHADAQGIEFDMLKSSINSIQLGKIDYFVISTHHPKIHEACIQFLNYFNYIIIAEHSKEESFSNDGLIAAKRKGVQGPDYIEISKAGKLSVREVSLNL
jgi:hypothetical protein